MGLTERDLDCMDTIPEDTTPPVVDPKSLDGILVRLSSIEQRLDEKVDNVLAKKVANMEESFEKISQDVLKRQEFMTPIVEAEIARLTTEMEQGMTRIRKELVQTTDEVANFAASFIDRLLKDLANVKNRVDKLENAQPASSLKLDGTSAGPAEATSKDCTGGKDVIHDTSSTSGSFCSAGGQILHSANMMSVDSAGATPQSSAMSDHGIPTDLSDAHVKAEKLQEKLAQHLGVLVDRQETDKSFLQLEVCATLEDWLAFAERQVKGADLLSTSASASRSESRSTSRPPPDASSCPAPQRDRWSTGSIRSVTKLATSYNTQIAIAERKVQLMPKEDDSLTASQRDLQTALSASLRTCTPNRGSAPLRAASPPTCTSQRDPLTVIPSNVPTCRSPTPSARRSPQPVLRDVIPSNALRCRSPTSSALRSPQQVLRDTVFADREMPKSVSVPTLSTRSPVQSGFRDKAAAVVWKPPFAFKTASST